jgi:hypothetical protein
MTPRSGPIGVRTSTSSSLDARFHRLVTFPTIRLPAVGLQFFPVQFHARVVVHIGDFQKHPLPGGRGGSRELLAIRRRTGKRLRAQILPRFQRRGHLLAVQVQCPVSAQLRQRIAGGEGRLRRAHPAWAAAHHNTFASYGPEHQRKAHRIALGSGGGERMNLARRQVPCLRLAVSGDGCRARFRLVALVEEEVHVAVAPAAVRVGQSRELGVQLHIRLGQRASTRGVMSPEGSISVAKLRSGYVLGIQERLVHDQPGVLPTKITLPPALTKACSRVPGRCA